MERQVDVARVEDLGDLVADEVDDRLEVELGREALLDAVDDRELGIALLGLLEQPLRLVEQPRVLECHAHAVRERLQQAHVRLAERVLVLEISQHDQPAHLIAGDQRYQDLDFWTRVAGQRGSCRTAPLPASCCR